MDNAEAATAAAKRRRADDSEAGKEHSWRTVLGDAV